MAVYANGIEDMIEFLKKLNLSFKVYHYHTISYNASVKTNKKAWNFFKGWNVEFLWLTARLDDCLEFVID